MKLLKYMLLPVFVLKLLGCTAQTPTNRAHCQNDKFDKKVASWLSFSIPTISPNDLKKMDNVAILDARERSEYDVSHIPNALFVGYNHFEKDVVQNIDKNKPIVVYCSIGYRSEKIGEKLQKMGYTRVYNLYGSIFEWINQGNQVIDNQGIVTKKVHTYNRSWSQWVDEGKAEKVW